MGAVKMPRWTDEAVARACVLAAADWSAQDIARELGRTRKAVQHKLNSLGVRTRHPVGNWWTDEEVGLAVRLAAEGRTMPEIAAALPGRSRSSVEHQLARLKVKTAVTAKRERNRAAGTQCRRRKSREYRGPTLADLDRLIAEQSRPENLPPWWAEECERLARLERAAGRPDAAAARESSRVRRMGAGVRVEMGQ